MIIDYLAIALVGFTLCIPASGHMNMKAPTPLNYELNVFRDKSKPIDGTYNYPLKADGSNYPCRGYANLMGTYEGTQVVTWTAGEKNYIILEPQSPSWSTSIGGVEGGNHYGGSCQVSLSYDQGKTFKVIKSFIGSCPKRDAQAEQKFYFTIPKEAPSGVALLSWSWFNREHEMFQNCASISIIKGGSGISHLPDMLVANIGNGCNTAWTDTEVTFPDPGLDVEYGDGEYELKLPVGASCGKTAGPAPSQQHTTSALN